MPILKQLAESLPAILKLLGNNDCIDHVDHAIVGHDIYRHDIGTVNFHTASGADS